LKKNATEALVFQDEAEIHRLWAKVIWEISVKPQE